LVTSDLKLKQNKTNNTHTQLTRVKLVSRVGSQEACTRGGGENA